MQNYGLPFKTIKVKVFNIIMPKFIIKTLKNNINLYFQTLKIQD